MSGLGVCSDEALLEAWREGQVAAFDVLYARYERPLFGFILRLLEGHRAEAEDVLHQTFMSVLREAKRREVMKVRALLYEVARNHCHNHRRAAARSAAAPKDVELPGYVPDELLMQHQRGAALQAALRRLPATLTEVWSLRAAGLSYDEVAEALHVPLGTVKSRLHEVLARLREELTR